MLRRPQHHSRRRSSSSPKTPLQHLRRTSCFYMPTGPCAESHAKISLSPTRDLLIPGILKVSKQAFVIELNLVRPLREVFGRLVGGGLARGGGGHSDSARTRRRRQGARCACHWRRASSHMCTRIASLTAASAVSLGLWRSRQVEATRYRKLEQEQSNSKLESQQVQGGLWTLRRRPSQGVTQVSAIFPDSSVSARRRRLARSRQVTGQ